MLLKWYINDQSKEFSANGEQLKHTFGINNGGISCRGRVINGTNVKWEGLVPNTTTWRQSQ